MDIDSSYIAPKVGDHVRVVMEGRVNWTGVTSGDFELNGVYGINAAGSQVVSVEILAPVEPPNGTVLGIDDEDTKMFMVVQRAYDRWWSTGSEAEYTWEELLEIEGKRTVLYSPEDE